MTIDRREFLRRVAAGSAIVTMPAWLQGCGVQPAQLLGRESATDPLLTRFDLDEPLTRRLLSTLALGGADVADVYCQERRTSRLTMDDGVLGNHRIDVQLGAGMRAIRGDDIGFATTDELAPEALQAAARQASRVTGEPAVEPLVTSRLAGNLYLVDSPWSDVAVDAKAAILEKVDALARAADPSIDRVVVDWQDIDEHVLIATLGGEVIADPRPMTSMTVIAIAKKDGATQSGFASIAARAGIDWYTDERLKELVQTAVDRTLIQFEARRVPTGELPVILAAGESGVILHEAIGHMFEADLVADGSSPLAGKLGEQVSSEHVSLIDDPAMPQERGAMNIDDEGSAASETRIIEDGTLRSFLHDHRSALAAGATSTGSGRRASYRHTPLPRQSCTRLENGPHSRDEIIASVDKGVICETYSGGSADIGGGHFSFDVKNGWLVENGRVTAPVKDFFVRGTGADLLGSISMVADDARMDPAGWVCGKKNQRVPVSHGMPTVLVDNLTVSLTVED